MGTRRLVQSFLLSLLLRAATGAQPVPIGGEFQVNTYTTGDQLIPTLSAAAGTFVVAWVDYFNPGYSNVRNQGRVLDAGGAPQGAEFEIGQGGYDPAVAVASTGDFLVTWERIDDVLGRRYDAGGTPQGPEFRVNTYTTGTQSFSDVAAGGGGFVVVWERQQVGFARGIAAQRYDGGASPLGTEFLVNEFTTTTSEVLPVVAAAPGGGFVVAWNSVRLSDGFSRILARRYDAAGAAEGDPFQVDGDTGDVNGPGISAGPEGEVVVVWMEGDGDGSGIFARRYDSAGTPLGTAFQVNTYTTSAQTLEHANFGFPRARPVAHDAEGRFLVAWASQGQDGSGYGIFGRRYTRAGLPDGPEVQINAFTTGAQHAAHVASATPGEFLVVWESDEQDGSGAGIFGRRVGVVGLPMTGHRLVVTNPPAGLARNRVEFVSRDATIAAPATLAEDPRCAPLGSGSAATGATLRVAGTGGSVEIALPCTGWSANAARTIFRYRDATEATCRAVTVRSGWGISAVCRGAHVTYSLGAQQAAVDVVLAAGSPAGGWRHCARFGAETGARIARDGSDGRRYRAVGAASPAACP